MAVADELLDFLPLFPDETTEVVHARMAAWANEGLDPDEDVDEWVDTAEGSHWWVSTRPAAVEIARLYDLAGTDVPASGFVVWAWADYLDDHAEVQDIVRLPAVQAQGVATFAGPPGTLIGAGLTVGVEPVDPDDDAPEFEVVTGGVIDGDGETDFAIRAVEAGVAGNVPALSITTFSTPVDPGVTVVNAAATSDGAEAETDEALRERVIGAYQGQGAGNKRDYERWARAWAGVGRATVIPLWNGPGTVKVIVTDADGNSLSGATVDALQADLDPTAGLGEGRAPIGAEVTVTTADALAIAVEANNIEFEPGYSLDGFGSTIALRDDIVQAVADYIERVEPGGEVVFGKVYGCIVTVTGVHAFDIADLTVNGAGVDVPVDDDPAEVPSLDPAPVLTAA